MEQKTFPAFGYFVIRNRINKGEIISDDLYLDGKVLVDDNFETCWLYTKGLVHQINVETQDVSIRAPGYCNAEIRETAGLWKAEFVEDSTVFCVPPQKKNPLHPPLVSLLKPFVLAAGQKHVLPQGTKLSLCQGKLSVGDTVINELRQIEFKTGSREVVAIEDCFGLIFP